MRITKKQFIDRVSEICTLVGFDYNGQSYGVDPFSKNKYNIYIPNGCVNVDSIEKVMNTPIVDGKSINDIFDDIEITEGF